MAINKSTSSTRTAVAPAEPAPSLPPLAHERQAEAHAAILEIQYGCRLIAALMSSPHLKEERPLAGGIEIATTVRALIVSMEQAAGRIVDLLLLESRDADAREAAMRG